MGYRHQQEDHSNATWVPEMREAGRETGPEAEQEQCCRTRSHPLRRRSQRGARFTLRRPSRMATSIEARD